MLESLKNLVLGHLGISKKEYIVSSSNKRNKSINIYIYIYQIYESNFDTKRNKASKLLFKMS